MSRLLQLLRRFVPKTPQPTAQIREALYQSRERDEDKRTIRLLSQSLADSDREQRERERADAFLELAGELTEAEQMCGTGPWQQPKPGQRSTRLQSALKEMAVRLQEANPIVSQGAYGDIELALQNVEWRREVNLSWLEFSRWGIQQIILISRLYYIKNPIIRRLTNICGYYTFGRGVEISSADESVNDAIKDVMDANKGVLGQNALTEADKAKYLDGNLFYAAFTDTDNTGEVKYRIIDPLEIQDIVTDPQDTDTPQFYRRTWVQKDFDIGSGQVQTNGKETWYPAAGFKGTIPETIDSNPVEKVAILHFKYGKVSRWLFGCPIAYPALDWAKAARQFLEDCASIARSLSRFAATITTKGGQQALAGVKQQMQTTVGPSSALWDMNPPTVTGGTFASGPGTTLEAFKTQGAGLDPEKVRRYLLLPCCVFDVPETFLADVSTGNLATATSLDRPTELAFIAKQEEWSEVLLTLVLYALNASKSAPNGKLRESLLARGMDPDALKIREAPRHRAPDGRMVYLSEAARKKKGDKKTADDLEVTVTFPDILEGDIPALVDSTFKAMAIDRQGLEHGLDPKTAVSKFCQLLDIEDSDELIEELYPEKAYERDRTKAAAVLDTGIPPSPAPPGAPQPQPAEPTAKTPAAKPAPKKANPQEARRVKRLAECVAELKPNGHATSPR